MIHCSDHPKLLVQLFEIQFIEVGGIFVEVCVVI